MVRRVSLLTFLLLFFSSPSSLLVFFSSSLFLKVTQIKISFAIQSLRGIPHVHTLTHQLLHPLVRRQPTPRHHLRHSSAYFLRFSTPSLHPPFILVYFIHFCLFIFLFNFRFVFDDVARRHDHPRPLHECHRPKLLLLLKYALLSSLLLSSPLLSSPLSPLSSLLSFLTPPFTLTSKLHKDKSNIITSC